MAVRGPRGKRRAPPPIRALPPDEATTQVDVPTELLDSLRDDSERPTVRMASRPPFAPEEDAAPPESPAEPHDEATVRRRVIVGPDGVPRTLHDDTLEEATRPHVPSKMLLAKGKTTRKKR